MINILHIINTLAPEGAPLLLMSCLKNFNSRKYCNFIAFIYGGAELLKEKKYGKRVEIFDLTKNGKFDYFSLYRLVHIIKEKKIDIVHTHLVHAGILGKIAYIPFTNIRFSPTSMEDCGRAYGTNKTLR